MAPDQDLTRVPMFTASEVQARTGVLATTLRQWERRYGFPRPVRDASGYRLYSPQDVQEIGWMLGHLRRGVSARRAAELARAGQGDPLAGPPTQPAGAPAPEELVTRLTDALLDARPRAVSALLEQAAEQMTTENVLLSVIAPSLVEIGRRWAAGEITIAHEHQASAMLRAHLSALMDEAEVWAGRGPLVVVACAPGEHHELGLMMITLALRRRGVRVAYVGPDTPLADLAAYVRSRGAQGLALGLQGEWALEPTRAGRPELDGLEVPLFLGGALLNGRPELAAELRGIYAGPDARGAADTIGQVVGARRGPGPPEGRITRQEEE